MTQDLSTERERVATPAPATPSAATSHADQRSVEREITIAAPQSAVWKALTDAEELSRWFPLEARVEPGPGGRIWMRWDSSDFDDARIETWEPEGHLRVVDIGGSWVGLATDYYLQAASGGGTILRVVSSGFGVGESWDDLIESFGSGWDFELRGLRHYLERHAGQRRVVAAAHATYAGPHAAAWERLVGANGWFGSTGLAALAPGARFAVHTATGDGLSGTVAVQQPPRQLVAAVSEFNDALLRIQLYGRTAKVWLSTYGVPADQIQAVAERWRRSFATLFESRS